MTNITFIIGNGFDLNLGLKTQYSDVYEEYIKTVPNSDVVSDFITSLKQDKTHKYKLWSDFELGMGQYAKVLESEAAFVECIGNFKAFMVQYLRDEENRYIQQWEGAYPILMKYVDFLQKSVENYYTHLIPNAQKAIRDVCHTFPYNYNFISFNYTTILDVLIKGCSQRNVKEQEHHIFWDPIHIHGRLNEDVLVGVDNEEQICSTFQLSNRGKRAFIKPQINSDYDQERVEKAMRIIANSNVICVYGLSFGKSDLTWVKAIANWLQNDPKHHLIYCRYDNKEYPRFDVGRLLDTEDSWKIELLTKLQISDVDKETILQQIHLPVGANIFGNMPVLIEGAHVARLPSMTY